MAATNGHLSAAAKTDRCRYFINRYFIPAIVVVVVAISIAAGVRVKLFKL